MPGEKKHKKYLSGKDRLFKCKWWWTNDKVNSK